MLLSKYFPTDSVRHAIKTGLAVLLSYLMTIWFDLDFGYWAPITTVIVMQNNIAESLEMSLYRTVGTLMGAAMGIVCILLFPDTLFWDSLGLALATGLCAFLIGRSNRYRMASITVTIVILASVGQPDRMSFSLFRVVEILVGVGAALLVSVVLWPRRAGPALRKDLVTQLHSCADKLDALTETFLDHQDPLPNSFLHTLSSQLKSNQLRLQKVQRHESRIYATPIDELGRMVNTVDMTVSHLQGMLHSLNGYHGRACAFYIEPQLRELAHEASGVLRWFADGQGPMPDLRRALEQTEQRLSELRAEGAPRRFELGKVTQFYAFYGALHQLTDGLGAVLLSLELRDDNGQ
ncbi:MAG: FUSC family protein [Pseudomonadota bacterium]